MAGPAFTLNSATDTLLKKEFDVCRREGKPHPLMLKYKVDAVPFRHPDIDEWRENFKGVQYHHAPTNLLITGAVDDIWVNPKGELFVVDYKATSKDSEITLDAEWQQSYKRQMEIYQWLLRKKGFRVSDTGYFVYCNGRRDAKAFDGKLEFDVVVLPYTGDDSWVDGALMRAYRCLNTKKVPVSDSRCEFCAYRRAASGVER